jgi:hypothetical protein
MRTRTVLPVVGTVAAVTALAVTVALVGPDGHRSPRPLRLAAGGAASGAAQDSASLGAPKAAGGSGYTLTGALPAGQPDDAPAYTLPKGPADSDVVAALARALKAGTPVRSGDGWRAGGLFVSGDAGRSWWFAPCAVDLPVSSDPDSPVSSDSRVGCATAEPAPPVPAEGSGGGSAPSAGSADGSAGVAPDTASDTPVPSPGTKSSTRDGTSTGSTPDAPPATPVPAEPSPAPEPDPVSKDVVRAAAEPVFAALGLDISKARVEGWPYGGSATLTPTVGGLEAVGLETSVQVDRDGKVQGANGWLGTPDKGDTYPLVTAQDAYDDLPPMVTTMMCPVGPDGQGCVEPEPTEITGAHLGLMVSGLADGGLALVPAWLFEVKGWTSPLPVVAVQAKYLPSPEPVASSDPGTVKPGDPGTVDPVPPATDPGAARTMFSFDKVARGPEANQVVVTYGDSSSCPHVNVTAQAKEAEDAVYVVLEADAQDPDVACTDDYRAMERTITLQAPLGDRKVYDASTNRVVPLS